MKNKPPAIGIIGGSGLYQMEEVRDAIEHKIETPFGTPSDMFVGGKVSGRQVYFLPRHGRGSTVRAMGLRGAGRCVSLSP
jgi:5'-methylthioadenosine phosphorylase